MYSAAPLMDGLPVFRKIESGAAISGCSHLTAKERHRLAGIIAAGMSLRAIFRALSRMLSSKSREIGRSALESGTYRSRVANGTHMLRRQRKATIETDAKLAACIMDRLAEGWTQEQIAGRLRHGIESTRPACRLPEGDGRLEVLRRPEGRAAVALSDPPTCPALAAPRSGVSRRDR